MAFSTKTDDIEIRGTPLRKFRGKFVDLSVVVVYGKDTAQMDFVDTKVIKSTVPYNLPVIRLEKLGISYTPTGKIRANCNWGKIAASASPFGITDFMDLKGHYLTMEAKEEVANIQAKGKPGDSDYQPATTTDYISWFIAEIDDKPAPTTATNGAVNSSVKTEAEMETYIKSLIDGKDEQSFASAFLGDATAKSAPQSLLNKVFDGSLIKSWIANGSVILDTTTKKYTVVK